jgi:hypothetical protein
MAGHVLQDIGRRKRGLVGFVAPWVHGASPSGVWVCVGVGGRGGGGGVDVGGMAEYVASRLSSSCLKQWAGVMGIWTGADQPGGGGGGRNGDGQLKLKRSPFHCLFACVIE